MKKRSLIILLAVCFLAVLISSCAKDRKEEYVSDSSRIVTTGTSDSPTYTLEYIKGDKMYTYPFNPMMRPALDWLKQNSAYSEKVMTWWDNGHMIQGYARRQPLAFTPCEQILSTTSTGTWNVVTGGELSDCTLLTNIAYAFLADTSTVTQGISRQHGVKWVFVAKEDKLKTAGMAKLLGDDPLKYLDATAQVPGDVSHKVFYQMMGGYAVTGFRLAYSDDFASIYELL